METRPDLPPAIWLAAVDRELRRLYGIDISEAEREQLETSWALGEAPEQFARWFGKKYDLVRLGT